jgi:hypothetical protein
MCKESEKIKFNYRESSRKENRLQQHNYKYS